MCRELASTLGALEGVLCAKVLKGYGEDKIGKHWLERNLFHRVLCRELAVTLGASDYVLCVKVLNSRQQVIANWRSGPEP